MNLKITLFAITMLITMAAGWQLLQPSPNSAPRDVVQPASSDRQDTDGLLERIHQLEAELATEKKHSAKLEQQLQSRQALESAPESAEADDLPGPEDSAHVPVRSSIPALQELTNAGIPVATAEAMREWIGENRLAMLNLRDRAEREGWLNSARYANELRKLINPELNLREQFGDDMYDRFLYATGKSNRVIAAEVYPDSAAVASGILAGDVVRSYASTTIYSMNDLKQATLEGEAGESVLVVLERDGMVFSITVPRGPLGIEMRMESHEPE